MGEIADDHIDRMMWDEPFDDDWCFGSYARPSGGRMFNPGFYRTCNRCGMQGLKWRAEGDGWRLFENERIEHNRLKPHECNPPSEDDFDVVEPE